MMHRRDLLNTAVTVGAASVIGCQSAESAEASALPTTIIDTNVSLFQWPFRRLPLDDVDRLVEKLQTLSITQAWAGSFEGLLHRDITSVNERLAKACRPHPELIPIGSINPTLDDWERDLRRCMEQHKMPAIRMHPNYHGYTLADPRFGQVMQRATAAGFLIQIAVAMEDTRTQHPMMQVADVDLEPLAGWIQSNAAAKVQLLNWRPKAAQLDRLAKIPGVYFDTARVEGTDGVAKLMRSVPAGRVMLGTHAPFLIPEAALIRTGESDLSEQEIRSLMWETAQAMLAPV